MGFVFVHSSVSVIEVIKCTHSVCVYFNPSDSRWYYCVLFEKVCDRVTINSILQTFKRGLMFHWPSFFQRKPTTYSVLLPSMCNIF